MRITHRCMALLLLTALLLIPASATSKQATTSGFRITVQNVRVHMPIGHAVHDIRLTATRSDIVLWQEIKQRSYKRAVRNLPSGWNHAWTRATADPISWRSGLFRRISQGKAILYRRTHGFAVNRNVTWVVLQVRATGRRFVVHNAHYVAHAWSNRPKWRHQKQMRQRMWLIGNAIHRDLIRRWVSADLAIAGGGDYNRRAYLPFTRELAGRRMLYPTGHRHIEWTHLARNTISRWVIRGTAELHGMFTDHPGRRMRVSLLQ
jgi:hypothetical protein